MILKIIKKLWKQKWKLKEGCFFINPILIGYSINTEYKSKIVFFGLLREESFGHELCSFKDYKKSIYYKFYLWPFFIYIKVN